MLHPIDWKVYVNFRCLCDLKDTDWSEMVPETERLDTSAHRARGLLAQKAKRQPPSRCKLKESLAVSSRHSLVSQRTASIFLHFLSFFFLLCHII